MKTTHEEALKMRESGLSVVQIAKQLGISKSTASVWTRGVILSDDLKKKLSENSKRAGAAICSKRNAECRQKREEAKKAGSELDLSDALIVAGLSLYWGEGNKKSGFTAITNGDPKLLSVFVKFLRERMSVKDEKIIIRIAAHSPEQLAEYEPFWLEFFGLPKENLRRGTIIVAGKKRTGKCKHGMCRLEVYDVSLIEKILSGIEKLGRSYSG